MNEPAGSSNATDGLLPVEADALARLNDLSSRLWTIHNPHEGLQEILGCRTAFDGESGFREVAAYRPDIVLLDIGMPGVDGYETCRRIRLELGDDVIIVAVTGLGQEQDKQRATDAGFNAHLTKPADPVALQELLLSAADRKRDGGHRRL